jgi:hypothetical protein
MPDFPTPDVRFDGIGAFAEGADDAARDLAERLNRWSTEHPNRRILQLSIQSAAIGRELTLTAILAYVDADPMAGALTAAAPVSVAEEVAAVLSEAEEIVADAQDEPSAESPQPSAERPPPRLPDTEAAPLGSTGATQGRRLKAES